MDKLLLHSCCAPCSSAIVEELYKHFDLTLYYYNPCITDKDEYYKRADELKKFRNKATIIIGPHTPNAFFEMAKGMEHFPEGGARCRLCYYQRLNKTAAYAKQNDFRYFSTTLTISPYKDSATINAIGKQCGWDNDVMYMPFDFGYLYIKSLQLCKEYNLYQQDYCGCPYSKNNCTQP
ncbi:MAG: epoxyqueuosine reductase QueH [Bacilli bacterium]|nr:epoxyqueuosine reductase QueH [Bacilli bacterium]